MSSSDFENVCKTPRRNYNDPKYILKKKVIKDLECYQESILIALLNQFCGITICRPRKQSKVALCCAKVKTIHVNGEDIEIMKISEQRFKPIYDVEVQNNVARATAFRRYEKNKRIFVHNFLFDLALEFGFFFDSKLSRKSTKTFSIERIQRIFYNGKVIIELQEIAEKGSVLTDHFFDLVNNGLPHTFAQKDKDITKIFGRQSIIVHY